MPDIPELREANKSELGLRKTYSKQLLPVTSIQVLPTSNQTSHRTNPNQTLLLSGSQSQTNLQNSDMLKRELLKLIGRSGQPAKKPQVGAHRESNHKQEGKSD